MEKAKIIELKETILEDNNADAQVLRQELKAQKTCLMNLMSSPGSGKTSTLLALKPYFDGKIKWGVMEADIDSDVDANTLIEAGIPSIQLHTGGMYPLMYEVSDVLVINKIDALPVFDFRKDYVEACARRLNSQIKIFYISAKTGKGVKELADYLLEQIEKINA